jgi:hypothetical protein
MVVVIDVPRHRTGHALSQTHGDPKAALDLLLYREKKNEGYNECKWDL